MSLAVVEMQVERAGGVQDPPDLLQPRPEEPEVVVELIFVRGFGEQLRRVAAPAEPGAVTVLRRAGRGELRRVCVRPVLNGGSA